MKPEHLGLVELNLMDSILWKRGKLQRNLKMCHYNNVTLFILYYKKVSLGLVSNFIHNVSPFLKKGTLKVL